MKTGQRLLPGKDEENNGMINQTVFLRCFLWLFE